MLRLGLGFMLFGLVAATQAAQPDEDFFEPRVNLLTTRLMHSGAHFLPAYQFSASVVLSRATDAATTGLGLGSTFQPPPVTKPQQEIVRAANTHRQQNYDGDRVSLPRLLRAEFKGEQANITFRPRAVLIAGERIKITFRSQSALIEEGRLKILLQPHAASMLWDKAF